MKKLSLVVLAALITLAATGCKSGDESTNSTVAPVVKKEATPVAGPKNGGPPAAGQATVGLNPNVDPNKFAPGSKSGGNN